jgi:membrane protease YdiL (CAAX protease family)
LELRRRLFEVVFPAFVVFVLWLDGWFYPLVLLPLLYVKFVDRSGLKWIGFRGRNLLSSALLGVCSYLGVILVWYLFFAYYLPPLESVSVTPYVLFTDVFWYPFYEEVAYRGFALAYLVPREMRVFSLRSLVGNLAQTLLFVSIHHRHVTSGAPLFLVPVLLLGLANGFIFLKTRNIFGCFLCHSLANALALLIPLLT